MIAWLMNPEAEHRIKYGFIRAFAEKLAAKNHEELLNVINNHSITSITTETAAYKSRYDITIDINGNRFIIENKTKSIGASLQLDKYKSKDLFPIALGLTDISFSSDVMAKYPHLEYKDILDILKKIPICKDSVFEILIEQYRLFLERELKILDLAESCFLAGNLSLHQEINKLALVDSSYTNNDKRFLNLYYLEKFKRVIVRRSLWNQSIWNTDKNMQSGVWLANYKRLGEGYSFNSKIEEFCKQKSVKLWFHIELGDGILSTRLEDVSGKLQLKCHSEISNKATLDEFKEVYKSNTGEYYASRVREQSDTFYLIGKNLAKRDLSFDRLEQQLQFFAERFGKFHS